MPGGRARARGRRPPPRSGDRGGEVLVELEEVMGGRDQSPFGPGGGSAASGEAGESAGVFWGAGKRVRGAVWAPGGGLFAVRGRGGGPGGLKGPRPPPPPGS